MKLEISDLLNEDNKFELITLRIHKKIKHRIISYLFLKQSMTSYKFIHILYIIISSISLIILSNEFIPIESRRYFSDYFREITFYSLTKRLKISHSAYLIICAVIFIISSFRTIMLINFFYKCNKLDNFNSLKNHRSVFLSILNHIMYILFSFMIEFLSFIFYIEIFPETFIIKKDSSVSQVFQIVFFILNAIMIISYNIFNYFCIRLINRPLSQDNYPIKEKFSSGKIILLIITQNLSLLHPLECYLEKKINNIWCIVYAVLILILLVSLYFIQINSYNIDNIINSLISFIGEFCFVSIIIEIIIYALDIKYYSTKELIFFLLIKIIFSFCLFFGLNKIYDKIMIKVINKKIFNNPYNSQFDNELNDSVLFIRELYKNKKIKYLSQINNLFIDHKKNCTNNNCACKLVILKKINIKSEKFTLDEMFKKFNYYIESILIHYNYQNNYLLSLLLSEHFLIYKENPLMSYSILQTLLHSNYENLTREQLIIIYECMTKYINIYIKAKLKKINIQKTNGEKTNLLKINKEEELSHYFNLILKIKKAIKFMIKYSSEFLSILNHKDNFETSSVVKFDEVFGDIKFISAPYLTTKILNELLKFLSLENTYTLYIEKHIKDLEDYSRNLTYEFIYKIFLFADFFWKGKIPENLINIFYIFNTEHYIYGADINQQIYPLLETKYTEFFNNSQNKYFILFKFTKGIKISYLSEMLARILNYKQIELINNDLGILLIRELIQPHENLTKKQFFLDLNIVIKDKNKYIFDKNGYMYDMKLNSTFQIGLNKNILMLSSIEINTGKTPMKFYTNKNLKIISINKIFEEKLSMSLPLIREFGIELKDLFGITLDDINYNYKKDLKKVRSIKEFKVLDTREYVLKNLFKKKGMNNNYHILSKYVLNDKDNDFIDKDNEREKILNENKNNNKNRFKIEQKLNNLFNNITIDTFRFSPIYYLVNNTNFQNNLKSIFDKINSYEQDKLESKNIFNDYMRLTTSYNENIFNQNYFMNLKIKPRLIYDTVFFLCKIELYGQSKLIEIKNEYLEKERQNNLIGKNNSNENLGYQNSHSSRKIVGKFDEETIVSKDTAIEEEINNMKKIGEKNSNYFKKKIRNVKTPKFKLIFFLTICILILLITCIITFNYQTNLVTIFDNIFNAIYYNYYQRAQFISVNTMILSMFYQVLNISSQHDIEEKQEVLKFLGKNIENSRILFINSFMNFQIELNADVTKLYEPFVSNKITVNWENKAFVNDYRTKTALILNDMYDVVFSEINDKDKLDCENLLLEHYLKIDRKNTPVYGNFVGLIYYFVFNYETGLFKFFKNLESSFYDSLDKYSKKTKINNFILEIIITLFFLIFFFINLYFLIQNNKYMFKNILYMFIDFTQDKNYDFNNKISNLLVEKKVSNYISLLKEFTPQNLDILKYDKDIKYAYKEKPSQNLEVINNIEEKETPQENKNKVINEKLKPKKIKNVTKFIMNKRTENLSNNKKNAFKFFNTSNKTNNFLKNDIRTLNNRDLNNLSNNSIINANNSRNNSTNILLDSTNNSLNNNNNSLISGSVKHMGSLKIKSKQAKKNDDNSNNITMDLDDLDIIQDDDIYELTIDKIFLKTQISMLKSIKIIIIIFIIFTSIFIIYSMYKLSTVVLFIGNFDNVVMDFSSMMLQFNEVIRYWNNIKTLFVLPQTNHSDNLEETENYFYQINNKVNYIRNNRINRYKRVKNLYEMMSDSTYDLNSTGIDFCLGHKRCLAVFYTNNLLSKDIESTVNLYAKEIENYYKDFYPNKDKIKTKEDIIKLFINDKFELLSLNINHVFIYIEQIFLRFSMQDEKDIIDLFHLEVKVLNVIELVYCALLNLFSVFFVYTYINRIIASVEISSIRINDSIQRIKIKSI